MSRFINAEWLSELFPDTGEGEWTYNATAIGYIDSAPSIDIVFCNECKFENTRKCPPHRMGLIHDASDYCSYGIRKTDGIDKHDEAIKALGHLIKQMKGADDE